MLPHTATLSNHPARPEVIDCGVLNHSSASGGSQQQVYSSYQPVLPFCRSSHLRCVGQHSPHAVCLCCIHPRALHQLLRAGVCDCAAEDVVCTPQRRHTAGITQQVGCAALLRLPLLLLALLQ
jgi:hypothetical protein